MGLTGRVDRVRIQEILDYSTYPNPRTLFDIMGFGRPVDDPKVLQLQPGALRFAWGCAVHMLAEGLGVTLDEIREVHERRGARAPARAAGRHREEGHDRGPALRAAGHRRRRAAHRRRARDAARDQDVAPDWPGSEKGDVYRILDRRLARRSAPRSPSAAPATTPTPAGVSRPACARSTRSPPSAPRRPACSRPSTCR